MNAKVLNRHKVGVPTGAVFIGRPSKWGNPFALHPYTDRGEVIARYAVWLNGQPELLDAARRELRGRDLVCFCAPKRCHGHVLLAVANAPDTSPELPQELKTP